MPNSAIDPIIAAAALICNAGAGLQPGTSIEWHRVHGGTRFNVIPENVSVSGALLTSEEDSLAAKSALENAVVQIMSAFRTEGTLHFTGEAL